MFSHSCILGHSCIVVGVGDQGWDLGVLCSGDVGDVHSCRWRIVWEERIGIICVMVHSCGDGLGIVAITISYDSSYSRIRVNVLLEGIIILFVMYPCNVSGVLLLHRVL